MLVEYYEDVFEQDPKALQKLIESTQGVYTFGSTGDPLVDKWEREIALGLDPDLVEGLTDEQRRKLEEEQRNSQRGIDPLALLTGA